MVLRLPTLMVSKAPIALSVLVHVAGVAWMGSGHVTAGTGTPKDALLEIEMAAPELAPTSAPEPPKPEPAAEPAAARRGPQAAMPTHRHDYPVAPDHDARPHDPALEHERARTADAPAAAPASAVVPPAEPIARFVLSAPISAGNVKSAPNFVAVGAAGNGAGDVPGAGGGASSGASVANEVVSESQVSVGARLVARANVAYPAAARASEIESDVPVEIVLDTNGRVEQARALGHVGYGLDEAAVVAVRKYRFTAALRAGRPVRVRMRWVVEFRLR